MLEDTKHIKISDYDYPLPVLQMSVPAFGVISHK